MIVVRRTFQCKTGQAGQAAQLLCEVARMSREADVAAGVSRIYTDLSGPTDRVVLETERSSFDHPRALSAVVHGHPDAPAVFGQLAEHITGAHVEFLELEHTV
jgi:hypothetical protein